MEVQDDVCAVEQSEEPRSGTRKVLSIIGGSLISGVLLLLFLYLGVRTIRDRDSTELCGRFLRNNEIVKQRTGGIREISGFGKTKLTGDSWEKTAKVYGNDNVIEVTLHGYCGDGMSDSGSACSISTAKYRYANGFVADWNDNVWHEIEIGWLEKTLLVFKP